MSSGMSLQRAFEVLGLDPGVTPLAARRRYLEMIRKWHPDRHAAGAGPAATRRTQEINEAYQVLKDAARHRRSPPARSRHAGPQVPPDSAPFDLRVTTPLDRVVASAVGMFFGMIYVLRWGDATGIWFAIPLILGVLGAVWGGRIIEKLLWWFV